jgi:hypothetical protein
MHLFGVMGDERSGPHRDRVVGIELSAGANPPRPFRHHEEAIIGMKMRAAEIAGQPLDEHDVEPGLGGVAGQDCSLCARHPQGILPLDLLRQLEGDGRLIELERIRDAN